MDKNELKKMNLTPIEDLITEDLGQRVLRNGSSLRWNATHSLSESNLKKSGEKPDLHKSSWQRR